MRVIIADPAMDSDAALRGGLDGQGGSRHALSRASSCPGSLHGPGPSAYAPDQGLQASSDRRPARNPARRHAHQRQPTRRHPAPAPARRCPADSGSPGTSPPQPRRLYAHRGYDFDKYRRPLWQRGIKPDAVSPTVPGWAWAAGVSPERHSETISNATAPSRRDGGRCHRGAWRRAWGSARPRVRRRWW